jgi:hypothetical protein
MTSLDSKHHQAHSGFYLTLVSIMQGLALGYLLQVVAAEVTSKGSISPLTACQATASLSIIIIVWHEYAIGTVLFRWKLDILDSAIPFLFGIVQYIMIAAISVPMVGHAISERRFSLWLWALPAFCLVSCLAYWNQYTKAVVDADASYIKPVPRGNLIQALGTALAFSLVAGLNSIFHFQGSAQWIAAACIATVFIGHAFRINKVYERRTQNASQN